MLALSDEQHTVLRSWIGDDDPPSRADLDARYDSLGNIRDVVIEVLRKRLAELTASPANLSIPGQVSVGTGENIKALRDDLATLRQAPADLGVDGGQAGIRVRRIVRPGRR